jgi:hypothetical protein
MLCRSPRIHLLFCLTVAAGIVRAEDYKIRIGLPAHVGDRAEARYIGTLTFRSVMNYDDHETKKEEDQRVEMDVIEEVRKVDSHHHATQVALEIQRCEEVKKDGTRRAIIPPGRKMTVTAKKDDTELKLDQGKLDAKDEAIVRLIIHLRQQDGPDDDELFGSKQRQSIGSSWPINSEAFAKQSHRDGYDPTKPEDVKGTTTLVAVQDVPGFGPCLQLEINFTIENMTGTQGEYKMIDGTYQSISEMLAPVDESLNEAPSESWASQYHQVYTATYDGKPVRVEQDTTRTIEGHHKILPPKKSSAAQPASVPSTVPSTQPKPMPLSTKPATTLSATRPATTSHVR